MRASRSSSSWSLRGNGNHEPKNGGHEPRVADDRAVVGLDEDPGVAERRRAHHRRPTLPASSGGSAVPAPGATRRSGDGRVGVLLAGAGDVLGPGRAVPVAQLVAAGRVGVPAGGHRRGGRRRVGAAAAAVRGRLVDEPHAAGCRQLDGGRAPTPARRLPPSAAAGAVPQPAGSLTAAGAARRRRGGRPSTWLPSRRRRRRPTALALQERRDVAAGGTMATTSQPSPDFSVSFAASEEAS